MEQENLVTEETVQETPQEETHEEHAEVEETPVAPVKDTSAAHNLRYLREEKERVQKENEDYKRRLWEYERQHQQAQQQKPEEKYTAPNPDDLVEWKQVDREFKRRDEENRRYRQQLEMSATESRLKAQFPDFDQIVSAENISLLNSIEPELADSIGSNPNMYNKAVAAYKAIKSLALPKDTYTEDKAKVLKNSAKPRPSNAAAPQSSDSPLAKANAFANRLTDEQKKAIWEDTQRILGKR